MIARMTEPLRFIDLFAGIGGFHAALKAFGAECVYAVEIDEKAARVYEANWGHKPNGNDQRNVDGSPRVWGDITEDAPDKETAAARVPAHDILCAGFPCQPFSKSGAQRGMDETRGTLFFNIAAIIEAHKPKIVILENVRNLIGPKHEHEYDVIIRFLRQAGYNVSNEPALFSPHLLPPDLGGTPQVRERVFITATYAPDEVLPLLDEDGHVHTDKVDQLPAPVEKIRGRDPFPRSEDAAPGETWDPGHPEHGWKLADLERPKSIVDSVWLTPAETLWINAWNDFVKLFAPLRGFPYWADSWSEMAPEIGEWIARRPQRPQIDQGEDYEPLDDRDAKHVPSRITFKGINPDYPAWKVSHMTNNFKALVGLGPKDPLPAKGSTFDAVLPNGEEARWHEILRWAYRWGVFTDLFPASRRKLEWQAQDTKTLWETVMHLRPSGIRAKRPTYVPALVAITQTSIVGPWKRRMSPAETALLQGLPEKFAFPGQNEAATYKQLGNGVAVGAVQHIFRRHVERDKKLLTDEIGERLVNAVEETTPRSVQAFLDQHVPAMDKQKVTASEM